MEDIKFVVNKDKKKVVCIINDTADKALLFVRDNSCIAPDCDIAYRFMHRGGIARSELTDKLIMPNRFVGIATCSPDDEWDEEIGRKVALHHAKEKMYTSMFKRLQLYINYIYDWTDRAVEIFNKYGKKISTNSERREREIKRLVGAEEE